MNKDEFEGVEYELSWEHITEPEPGHSCEVHRLGTNPERLGAFHYWQREQRVEVDSSDPERSRILRALSKRSELR